MLELGSRKYIYYYIACLNEYILYLNKAFHYNRSISIEIIEPL